jgi:hypothetical protein
MTQRQTQEIFRDWAHLTFLQLTGLPSQSEALKVAVGFIPRMDVTDDMRRVATDEPGIQFDSSLRDESINSTMVRGLKATATVGSSRCDCFAEMHPFAVLRLAELGDSTLPKRKRSACVAKGAPRRLGKRRGARLIKREDRTHFSVPYGAKRARGRRADGDYCTSLLRMA